MKKQNAPCGPCSPLAPHPCGLCTPPPRNSLAHPVCALAVMGGPAPPDPPVWPPLSRSLVLGGRALVSCPNPPCPVGHLGP